MAPPPTPRPRLMLSRATPEDAPAIAAAEYLCFNPYIREVFMGVQSEADIPKLAARYAATMRDDPHDVWMKVVDADTGDIAAASNWKVFPSRMPEGAGDKVPDYLVGEEARARSQAVMDGVNGARRRANSGGFIHLHICFTHPRYRRQGAGGMMVRWGCDLADQLFLPGWVEASPEGTSLYRAFGFYEHEKAKAGELNAVNMKRDARTKGLLQENDVPAPCSS